MARFLMLLLVTLSALVASAVAEDDDDFVIVGADDDDGSSSNGGRGGRLGFQVGEDVCADDPLKGINAHAKPSAGFNLRFTYKSGRCNAVLVPGRGNPTANSFSTLVDCRCQCGGKNANFINTETFPKEVCRMEPFAGNGRAIIHRWFFDAASGECKEFVWSGQTQPGNCNRFDSQQECQKKCGNF